MPFRNIIGHRRLVALLARSVERASVPPSLIFAGPAGVGKRLVALATAQALNCLQPRRASAPPLLEPIQPEGAPLHSRVDYDACGTCAACTRIARSLHPDVPLLEPGDSGSIKIEAVREMIDRAGYRPFEGRRRVVIIDQADALVPQAQNALLKTLEEPPSASMFILVSARPDALLATVRSRCHHLRFRPLGADDVAAALIRHGKSETEARAIAAIAEGSIGRALETNAEELVDARAVAVRVLSRLAATDDPRHRVESTKDLLMNTGAGGGADRQQLATHLRAMASLLRDVELLWTRADRRALANPDVEPALTRLAVFRGERGIRAFAVVDQALVALEHNAGVKIVADWVAMQV